MPTEREKLIQDINGLKASICLAWMDMIFKPMTAAEREELISANPTANRGLS
jgi:hypothetical protein